MAHSSKQADSGGSDSTRITVTLPQADYEQVCRIAKSKRVSASWVVRDAVTDYLHRDIPLFAKAEGSSTRNAE